MIKSFFFIPGNHSKIREKINLFKTDFVVIDLEDSVNEQYIDKALENISSLTNIDELFIRIRLFNGDELNNILLKKILQLGFKNILVPKFRTIDHIKKIEKELLGHTDIKVILLIENPMSLLSLTNILTNTALKVFGIGFGSQDYCHETNIEHTLDNLKYPRFMISMTAKAFDILSIDIACMEINSSKKFEDELEEAKAFGFDGKFLIHPNQLDTFNKFKFFTDLQVNEAVEIIKMHNELGKPAVFTYNGKAIEPPHIKNYTRIVNWKRNYETK